MKFLAILLGQNENTEERRGGFARYSYNIDHYPLQEDSNTELAFWSFAQSAASIVHNVDQIGGMYAKITHHPETVTIESRQLPDWVPEDYPQLI